MKILIVGSTHTAAVAAKREEFIAACRQIGAALARAGMDIVIGSDSESAADRYVFEGVASVKGHHRVWVLRPEHGEMPFLDKAALLSNDIEIFPKRLKGRWSAGRVPQILAADAVLLIGGAGGTLTAGFVAPALERPVLAIASFGGAAAQLWPELEPYYSQLGELRNSVDRLREQWNPAYADLTANVLKELIKRGIFKTKPRMPLGIYMPSLVVLLFFWVYLFARPFPNPTYSLFGMLSIAGLLGTFLRNNLRLVFDPSARFSWNELFIEIGAGLILGFTLALLYLAGSLTIFGGTQAVTLSTNSVSGGFQRDAVVMTLLGMGGGLMIEQAAERVRGWFSKALVAARN